MHLLDLQEAASDARPERRLGHVLEDELGLEDPTEIAVCAIKAVLRTAPGETSQGDRGGGVSGFKRGVEMTESIPLVGDPSGVDLPILSAHQAPESAVSRACRPGRAAAS